MGPKMSSCPKVPPPQDEEQVGSVSEAAIGMDIELPRLAQDVAISVGRESTVLYLGLQMHAESTARFDNCFRQAMCPHHLHHHHDRHLHHHHNVYYRPRHHRYILMMSMCAQVVMKGSGRMTVDDETFVVQQYGSPSAARRRC